MPKLTLETCKAPRWEEAIDAYPALGKSAITNMLTEAEELKATIADSTARLKQIALLVKPRLDRMPADEFKSVVFGNLLVTRTTEYTRYSLDSKWAKKRLIAKGVKQSEIDAHTKETEIEAGVKFQLLGEEEE